MTFEESLRKFINSITAEHGTPDGVVKIALTPELFNQVVNDLRSRPSLLPELIATGEVRIMGVQIVARRREDHPSPDESLIELMLGYDRINNELRKFFDGDEAKVQLWITTPNLNFGGSSPWDVIVAGRGHKVLAFIEAAKDEGGW